MDLPREDKSELYMKALDYARENALELSNMEDIGKIAMKFDPTHSSTKDLEELQYQLQNAAIFINISSAKDENSNQ